jgi:hypothetical protein
MPRAARVAAALSLAAACVGAFAQPLACPDDPRCPPDAWRGEGRPLPWSGPRSDAAEPPLPAPPPRPAAPAPRDPGTAFDRDGRFQGRTGGTHPFDARIDSQRRESPLGGGDRSPGSRF